MTKKLLGDRTRGETEYKAGTIFTDEEAVATGLPDTDFATVKEPAAVAPATPTPVGKPDAAAELDTQAKEKNDQGTSNAAGSDAGDQGGSSAGATSGADAATKEHILTEQDFVDHPELKEQGHNVGDKVLIPA